jgi:hypothetical protein
MSSRTALNEHGLDAYSESGAIVGWAGVRPRLLPSKSSGLTIVYRGIKPPIRPHLT